MPMVAIQNCSAMDGCRFSCGVELPDALMLPVSSALIGEVPGAYIAVFALHNMLSLGVLLLGIRFVAYIVWVWRGILLVVNVTLSDPAASPMV